MMKRGPVLLLTVMTVALVLASGVALAEIIVGTDDAETLTGTNSNDHMNGKGGNDTLNGRAGNDTYHFDNGFGQDTLIEPKKVGKLPGGTDTISFSQCCLSDSGVDIFMVPQWADQGFNEVGGPGGGTDSSVDLGTSVVEKVVGGSGQDDIRGGSAINTYKGGPGGNDNLRDFGGNDGSGVGNSGLPDLPASNDTYKGFTSAGNDIVEDHGGTADKLDLRPLESSDVAFDRSDEDSNGSRESLKIIINGTTEVLVHGHFAPIPIIELENGRIEQIIFSDEVVTSAAS